jgi:[ribosomal protein S18]-alanine N-acetyltransferase
MSLVYLEAATPDDLAALVELERAGSAHPWTPAHFADAIRGAAGERVVVLRLPRATVIGYCVWQEVSDEVHIHNLGIAAGHRRQGLGRRLLAVCLDLAARRQARRAFLDVRAGNAAARALYRRLGFREAGSRARYYSEPVEDAVLLEASLEGHGIRTES